MVAASRDASIARTTETMREFIARAVLFQDAVARHGGLNSTDMQVVGLLMSEGPATPGELAARTGLTAGGAVTTVIDRLERAGYATRERDATDRRKVIVTAVPEAVYRTVGPIYARVGERWTQYIDTLDDDQIELVNEVFERAAEINREEIERLRQQ